MANLLIELAPIKHTSDDEVASYSYVLSKDDETLESYGLANLELLVELSRQAKETVVTVPMSLLSWHKLLLPRGSLRSKRASTSNNDRLMALLIGSLEDQLLDDPSLLNFAIQPGAKDESQITVCAYDHHWLVKHVELLKNSGIKIDRIIPAIAPEYLENTTYVQGSIDQPTVCTSRDGVPINFLINSQSMTWLKPRTDELIISEPVVADYSEKLFSRQIQIKKVPEIRLLALNTKWNLDQFKLSATDGLSVKFLSFKFFNGLLNAKEWQVPRILLSIVIVLNLLGLNFISFQRESELKGLSDQIKNVFTQTFPDIKILVDAPVQMTREVKKLQRLNGIEKDQGFEKMMRVLSYQYPNIQGINKIDFKTGELRLSGSFPEKNIGKEILSKSIPDKYKVLSKNGILTINHVGEK